ncbi:hypothetical protein EG329_005086 [Mollisiaceae sp. DMI_Dod_QoI]|nr:hypothetical protein EG329_005086 [Helotiales sp. DMI_Dod_QoI]
MLPTTLLTLGAILGITSALPVEYALDKRVCGSVSLPQTLVQLHENDPDTPYGDTAHTNQDMLLYQDVNGATGQVADRISELVAFVGPVGAYGCSLGLTFPSDYTFPTYTGATPTLNIYTVPEPIPADPTWNNIIPNKGSLWGTVTVSAGTSAVINTETCPTTAEGGLAFVFEYADWVTRPASVEWNNYVNAMNGAGLRGVYLSYDC